ncbi:C-C motif chemokine 20a.3 [Aulostomus maculatus]
MVAVKALLLLAICLMATNTSAAYNRCCRTYTRQKIPFGVIKGYSVQTVKEMCPINAIIFHVKRGKACSDPALDWVMDYVDRLRTKARKVRHDSPRVPQ